MQTNDRAKEFIKHLENNFSNDAAAKACFRRGLGNSNRLQALPLLGRFLDDENDKISNYVVVAALWADSDCQQDDVDLGSACARLAKDYSSFEGRFRRLISCDRKEIATYVVPVVRALNSKGIRIDFSLLLTDLLLWGDRVKIDWSRSFWRDGECQNEKQSEE